MDSFEYPSSGQSNRAQIHSIGMKLDLYQNQINWIAFSNPFSYTFAETN